jgi:hypothetical protein
LAWKETEVSDPANETKGDQQRSEEERAARELRRVQELQERVDRARGVLASDYSYLHEDALADVVGIDDPYATATLRAAAMGEFGSGGGEGELKTMSAEYLWRHAADLNFADRAANRALVELSESEDNVVRRVARQALEDMEYYVEEGRYAEAAR